VNWKNVLRLISADTKSYRIVRGDRFRRFRESKIATYALYIGACVLGSIIGWLIGNFYIGITDLQVREILVRGAIVFFVSFPTVALLYGLIFTQISQFQRAGVKVSVQPLYWFPITWEEHTLASVIANVLGLPLAVTLCATFGMLVVSVFMNLVPMAILTIFALFVSVFMASVTTEITKILRMRAAGAITKVAGRAAVWLRLISSILFFIIFYVIYFSLYYQTNPVVLLEMVASGQKATWFIPYVWPGIALSNLAGGRTVETILFLVASILFDYALFLVATKLNVRYGLYEMPAVKISKGVHVSKAGLLGMLGLSPLEAAMVRKDFKALTRRQELAYIFIFPIVLVIMPILSALRAGSEAPAPYVLNTFLFTYLTLLPGAAMATMLGSIIVGLEGEPVWYIYSSPIDARSLIKAKYSIVTLFSLAVMAVCSIIGGIIWTPLGLVVVPSVVEAVLLILSLSAISLDFGVKGADLREFPRPRGIRPKWALVNGLVCIVLASVIVSPIVPYALNLIFKTIEAPIMISLSLPDWYIYFALPLSGAIAFALAYAFYHNAVKNAEEFLKRAEEPLT